MSVKQITIREVYDRAKGFCECWCWKRFELNGEYADGFWWEFHHIYWKSQYKKSDRNESRNLSFLYWQHHLAIHNGQAHELDERLKREADERKPIDERSKKKIHRNKIIYWAGMKKYDKKLAKKQRESEIEYFKKNNWWLTPSQYAYRKQKLFIDNMKNGKNKH